MPKLPDFIKEDGFLLAIKDIYEKMDMPNAYILYSEAYKDEDHKLLAELTYDLQTTIFAKLLTATYEKMVKEHDL